MNKAFNKVIKSHVLLAALTVFAAVLLTTSVTYSLFQVQHKNTKNQTIAVGNLSADMASITGAMILNDLYPEEASKITDEDKKYEFTLKNDGTFDLKYEIYLLDATATLLANDNSYSSYKKMSANHYQYINYKLDGGLAKNLESVNDSSRFTILKGTLKAGTSEDHYLQFFLDSKDTTTTGAPNDISGSVLSLDIYMDAAVSDTIVDAIIASAKSDNPTEENTGIYKAEDDYGTSYYFKGDVKNNYVEFAGMYWRILRINGDGTMRLMYDGTTAHENTDTTEDRIAIPNIQYTDNANDAKYAGYMYGVIGNAPSTSKQQALGNTNDNTIKTALDSWYKTNIASKNLDSKIADRIFCNDRSTASEENIWASEDTALGYGANRTVYGNRLSENRAPSLVCIAKEDSFTVKEKRGNGALEYPIGLPTADELLLANGTSSYINKGLAYWTMTPIDYTGSTINVFQVDENGNLTAADATTTAGIVPVINLTSEFTSTMQGTGTHADPYRVR